MDDFSRDYDSEYLKWNEQDMGKKRSYVCGYCGVYVASEKGLKLSKIVNSGYLETSDDGVYICTNCHMPSFFYNNIQVPGNKFGSPITNLPDEVNKVYEEARSAFSANAFTGVVLLCRKLLMNVAVDQGADPNLRFVEYVDYIDSNHIAGINSRNWIDQIRQFGNQANHEIEVNSKEDAELILKFCEMILKITYEYPAMVNNEDN